MNPSLEALKEIQEALDAAANADTLDTTVYYSGMATTSALTSILTVLMDIRDKLNKIEEHLKK